jgi:hypothetical protein
VTENSLLIAVRREFLHFFPILEKQNRKEKNDIDTCLQCMYNVIMEHLKFEWDENKNEINRKKHKISFEEAATVFYDDEALVIDDPDHSEEEERFIIMGFSEYANLLVVCHCYRASETVIRIISARKATKTERYYYER